MGQEERHKTHEDIEFDRWHIGFSFSVQIISDDSSGFEKQFAHGFPESTVVMHQISCKMGKKIMKRRPVDGIFLSAIRAKPFLYEMSAIETVFFFAQRKPRHGSKI